MALQDNIIYELTDKVYNPKAAHNIAAYQRLQKCIGKDGATHKQCVEALSYTDEQMKEGDKGLKLKQQVHSDFIGYMERGGFIKIKK